MGILGDAGLVVFICVVILDIKCYNIGNECSSNTKQFETNQNQITNGEETMSLYDTAKDMISIAQKMDNVDLTRQLFDIQQQAFELQEENYRLRTRIHEMEEEMRAEAEIERHPQPYLTLAGDVNHILCNLLGNE